MLAPLLLVLVLSFTLAVGGGASYTWLTQTHGWPLVLSHLPEVTAAVALASGLTLVNLCLRWLRWAFLLRRFHARVPTRETFQLFFVTAALITPLYLGELLRGLIVARRSQALRPVVGWVWAVERCSDIAALLVIWGITTQRAELAIPGAALLIGAPFILAHRTQRLPDADKLHTGQLSVFANVMSCASLSLLAWMLPVFALLFTLALLGLHVPFRVAGEVFAYGTLHGALTGMPAGIGTTGGTMIVDLTAFGIAPSTASVAILALRLGTQWFAVAMGAVLAVLWRRSLIQFVRSFSRAQQHFDALAPTYADNIPEHYRQQMLERKIGAMLARLPTAQASVRGLDLGCGHGWYASELARRGYSMHGIDLSQGQIAEAQRYCHAQRTPVTLTTYDGVHLPYPDGYFDFAYSINVLHHVPSPEAQRALMAEVLRVLKPGSQFLLHEMNVENVLFRAYVSYIFPLLKSIDEGTELWIRPTRLPSVPGGVWQRAISYFTFVPEFLPAFLLRLARPLERWLENSPLKMYSAHYMAALMRLDDRS